MPILLTGGSGFIGKNLIELMGHRHQLLAPSSKELNLLDEDAVEKFLIDNEIDFIIHSATTPGHRNAPAVPDLVARNLRMFFNLARNKHRFKKMIYLGSGAIYDGRHYQPRMAEDYFDAHVPADPHGFSKYVLSKYIEHEPNIIELRIFGIFGKYEDYAIRFISNAICKSLCGLPITLRQNRRFDYLYVNDLVPIIEHFIECSTDRNIYNACNDHAIDLLTLAEKVREISGAQSEIIVSQPGRGLEYSGDNSQLRAAMPALAFTPMDAAIGELYNWYANNRHSINKELLLSDK
ncbi:MAG TPA: NAD(P)-dependent oxidoreductase [Gammaproteobacteria bacterium]|nr:NAD(P)-dependent oxidoreductase [Gammaproteobacteria bacterium]